MKSGLDIGAFQKSSRARPGLTQWLRVLVTRVLPILGPRVPLKRGAAAAARAAPLHPAWHTLAAPAPPRRFCALGVGQLGRGLGSQPPCRELVSLAGGGGWRAAMGRRLVVLPSAPEKVLSPPFSSVVWAHSGGVASKVANVHKHSEARE